MLLKHLPLLALTLALLQPTLHGRETLLKFGSNWNYNNGERPFDPTWKNSDFDDKEWENGAAPFVYGHYQGNTNVQHSQKPRPITTYYRTSFNLDDPDDWKFIQIQARADDGFVLYLNGTQTLTLRVPKEGAPDAPATHGIKNFSPPTNSMLTQEHMWVLKKGRNTVAMEVRQFEADSSDLVMDLEISGAKKGTIQTEIFDEASTWSYHDLATRPEGDWIATEYDDSSWKTGKSLFGYGIKEVTTITDKGNDPKNPHVTTWFRKTFQIDETNKIDTINLTYLIDDGAVFYLNGEEVLRHNLPQGFVDHHSYASHAVTGQYHTIPLYRNISGHFLRPGKNVMAVSVHQNQPSGSDLSFALALGIEHREGQEGQAPINVVASNKTIDITDKNDLEKSEAGDWLNTSNQFLSKAVNYYQDEKISPAVHAYYASKWANEFSRYGDLFSSNLKDYLLDAKQVSVSQEFFDLYSPSDDHHAVCDIIGDLFSKQETSFKAFPKLAMAIAIVYDEAPPTNWPHHQVDGTVLPRKLPDPQEAMKFWVETDRSGKSLQALKDLSIEELKFVVDTPASFDELKEAQSLRARLGSINDLYSGINYVVQRRDNGIYNWPHLSYALPTIKEKGGICVDQAYYTVQVAKAHGVPAMMVCGAGNNGNHAWVGFLDNRERWDFTVGRYDNAKFVTGITFDPQTWEQPTDHQLAMMSERFRTNPKYRISRVHTVFSSEYLRRKNLEGAIKAAEAAIDAEERNFSAWEALIAAKKEADVPTEELDEILENGAKAFFRYADLELDFLRRLSNSYEAQDRLAEAQKIRARIISRNRRERPDLALEEAKSALEQSMINEEIEDQLDLYKKQILRLKDAGLIAYYALTNPFLEHLLGEDREDLAKTALDYTERRLDAEEGSQLESALTEWESRIGD